MNARVEWLVVGAQKSGTTALDSHLRDARALSLPDTKELHFFDDDGVDWQTVDYAHYESRWPAGAGLRGEITPIYAYWPNGFERIARYNPEMKIIFVLRDRIRRAWSNWRMMQRAGHETLPFDEAIRGGRERVSLHAASTDGHHRAYSYIERGFYAAQIERAQRLFGRERVQILLSADLRARPEQPLADLARFLGVTFETEVMRPRIVHEGAGFAEQPPSAADIAYLEEVFAEDVRRLRDLTGIVVPPER